MILKSSNINTSAHCTFKLFYRHMLNVFISKASRMYFFDYLPFTIVIIIEFFFQSKYLFINPKYVKDGWQLVTKAICLHILFLQIVSAPVISDIVKVNLAPQIVPSISHFDVFMHILFLFFEDRWVFVKLATYRR